MKKLFFGFCVLVVCGCGSSKKKTVENVTSTSLEQRLDEFMEVTDKMDLEKILDYTYPKLFTIVPRVQLVEAMKEGFNNAEIKMEMDSLHIDKVYPVFQVGKGSYAKVNYSMIMYMILKNKADSADDGNTGQIEMVRPGLEAKFGKENVSISGKDTIKIRTSSPMVAVKDEHAKEWSFVNLNEGEAMISKLFSKDVLDKLATYN